MTRTLSPSIAEVAESLELEQAVVVTTPQLHELVKTLGVATPPHLVVQRLAVHGWLLPTGVRGTWEFAPASHAGAYSRADPYIALRAQLAVTPLLPARIALGSALWKLGLADRAPDRHEISLPAGTAKPSALARAFRVLRFNPKLPPVEVDGLPVLRPASVLAQLADSPSDVRNWGEILDLLPDLVHEAPAGEVLEEAGGRSHAAKVRLAYLLDGIAPRLVEDLGVSPRGKVWFGPRGKLRRHNAKWNIADTVLPRAPANGVS